MKTRTFSILLFFGLLTAINNAHPAESVEISTDSGRVVSAHLALPSVAQVNVSGFCWGGSQSFCFATNEDSLAAAYVFYGSGPPAEDIARIMAPVYGFYAENDNRINAPFSRQYHEI